MSLVVDIWVISVIVLFVMEIFHVKVSETLIVKSLFPNTFANNWYLSCYLLFYPIHGLLNRIIRDVEQKSLLRICFGLGILYLILNFFDSDLFFSSMLIRWITMYLIAAYSKFYLTKIMNSKKVNAGFIIFGLAMNTILILITNILGLHISFFSDKLQHWWSFSNPFILLAAIGSFNLARQYIYHNKIINYVSGLSLIIYVIHENILVRSYLRPAMWQWVYVNFGYSNILFWVFSLSLIIFFASAILAELYRITIRNLVIRPTNTFYNILKKTYFKLERKILSFDFTDKIQPFH